jgi:predicted NBD/HSP70 family sugar kinase
MRNGSRINAEKSKEHNRKLLLRHILNTGVSRSDIASLTGLTRAGAGVIVDSLIRDGFLDEEIVRKSGKGRSPKNLHIRNDALYALGINITRHGCALGVCGLNGAIHIHRSFSASYWKTREEAVEFTHRQLEKLLDDSKIKRKKIIAAGLTTPGPVDSSRGMILTPPDFDLWEFYPIAEAYEKKIGIPAYLENNAIARTIEEQYYGLGKNYEDFINLVIDNGIGGGIVVNNELIKGVGGCGSELGHISINSKGKKCYCGNIGCLEMYANPRLFTAEAEKAGHKVAGWNGIAAAAEKGNAFFLEMVERMAGYLACECTSLINLFEPQVIIISGELSQNSSLLIKLIQENIEQAKKIF